MKQLPPEMADWYFPFNWDNGKLWSLSVPVETKPFSELEWHFDIPIWSTVQGKMLFNLHPRLVLQNKGVYPFHDMRIENADVDYPLEMMFTKDRCVILDGIHRLARYHQLVMDSVKVRIIPIELLPMFVFLVDGFAKEVTANTDEVLNCSWIDIDKYEAMDKSLFLHPRKVDSCLEGYRNKDFADSKIIDELFDKGQKLS